MFGVGLFSISLAFSLVGPTPWRAKGSGKLKLLFLEITVGVRLHLGRGGGHRAAAGRGAAAAAGGVRERGELAGGRAGGDQPAGGAADAAGRAGCAGAAPGRRTDRLPAARCRWTSRSTGSAPSGRATPRTSRSTVVGRRWSTAGEVEEPFAIAQFQDFTDAEKLSRPAFQDEVSGLRARRRRRRAWRPAGRSSATSATRPSSSTSTGPPVVVRLFGLVGRLFTHFLGGAAVTRSPLSRHVAGELRAVRRHGRGDGRELRRRVDRRQYEPGRHGGVRERGPRPRVPGRRSRAGRRRARDPDARGGGRMTRSRLLHVPALAAAGHRQPPSRRPTATRRWRPARGVGVRLRVTGRPVGGARRQPATVVRDVELYGPGDIVGIERSAIVKVEPRDWITNFEPNYLPLHRVLRRGLPLALHAGRARRPVDQPAAAVARAGRARREDEFRRGRRRRRPAAAVHRGRRRRRRSRRPAELWAWAHVHVNRAPGAGRAGGPTTWPPCCRGSRRCSRRTPTSRTRAAVARAGSTPNTAYHAFLVPAFETGRLAGLGLDPAAAPFATARRWDPYPVPADRADATSTPTTTAGTSAPATVGDFEYLVRLLEPRPLDARVGRRDMDVRDARRATCPASTTRRSAACCGSAARCRCRSTALDEAAQQAERTRTRTGTSRTRTRSRRALAALVNLADDYTGQTRGREANAEPPPAATRRPTPTR